MIQDSMEKQKILVSINHISGVSLESPVERIEIDRWCCVPLYQVSPYEQLHRAIQLWNSQYMA